MLWGDTAVSKPVVSELLPKLQKLVSDYPKGLARRSHRNSWRIFRGRVLCRNCLWLRVLNSVRRCKISTISCHTSSNGQGRRFRSKPISNILGVFMFGRFSASFAKIDERVGLRVCLSTFPLVVLLALQNRVSPLPQPRAGNAMDVMPLSAYEAANLRRPASMYSTRDGARPMLLCWEIQNPFVPCLVEKQLADFQPSLFAVGLYRP